MELKIVKEEEAKQKLILETRGETFTLTNLLRDELWRDKNVSEAAQIREHPVLSELKLFVRTRRGHARTALQKAAKRLIRQVEEFEREFKRAVKET
jgi:DNA-directed RNA polymerase subunit L